MRKVFRFGQYIPIAEKPNVKPEQKETLIKERDFSGEVSALQADDCTKRGSGKHGVYYTLNNSGK